MKKNLILLGLSLALVLPVRATIDYTATPGLAIADNSTVGTGDQLAFNVTQSGVLQGLTLNFGLQGGFASDLTGYLRFGNTVSAPFYDLTSLIQAGTLSAGSPTSYSIGFTTPGFQSAFNGVNPNGTWTLFLADTSAGGVSTLQNWQLSMDIVAVPELETWIAAALAGVFGAFWLNRQIWAGVKKV